MSAQVAIVAGGGELGRAAVVGPPAVLVNTIGAFVPGDALSTTPETLRLMIDVNLGPALWLSQAVVPHMQQGSGVIVHVAARPGLESAGGIAAQSASKAALVHLTRTLAIELGAYGIRVNAVAPQLLDTAANQVTFPPEAMAKAVGPEAIADVIASLLSDAAAPVSGGPAGVWRFGKPTWHVNHCNQVTTHHLAGGKPRPVAKPRTATRARARDSKEIP